MKRELSEEVAAGETEEAEEPVRKRRNIGRPVPNVAPTPAIEAALAAGFDLPPPPPLLPPKKTVIGILKTKDTDELLQIFERWVEKIQNRAHEVRLYGASQEQISAAIVEVKKMYLDTIKSVIEAIACLHNEVENSACDEGVIRFERLGLNLHESKRNVLSQSLLKVLLEISPEKGLSTSLKGVVLLIARLNQAGQEKACVDYLDSLGREIGLQRDEGESL